MNEIEEVKARLDIVDIVGQHVQLQKAGRTFKALCPFHSEKTPSFIVSPDRQSWHCFGACGTGGDVISFVMRKDGLEFPEALRILAERAGVRLQERSASPEQQKQRDHLLAVNEAAAEWFARSLKEHPSAADARSYLERRGIDAGTAKEFRLGYSLNSWEALRDHLREHAFSDREIIDAGVASEGESGPRDRFRNRLMFPIWDARGRVIGFGARALDDSLPKYINTAQTRLFDKGGTLYALHLAQQPMREAEKAVIVEGYMDVIAAHQHGFKNVVASMGTALTERQVRLLKRSANTIVLALDADAAGTEAAIRGHDVVREVSGEEGSVPVVTWRGLASYQSAASVELRVAALPDGRDPDDVIRSDAESWRSLIENAVPVLDYRLEAAASAHDMANPRGRSEFVTEFLPLLRATSDPVVRAHYLQRVSRLGQVGEEELNRMLGRISTGARRPQAATQAPAKTGARPDPREEFLLALLLQYPHIREDGVRLSTDLFWETQNQQIFSAWKEVGESEAVKNALAVELQPIVERLFLQRLPAYDESQAREALADCVRTLERRNVRAEKQALVTLLAEHEERLRPNPVQEDDEKAREFQTLHMRDQEIGIRLHARDNIDGPRAVETNIDG